MSYNGSGTFQINTSGQPVVTGTVISSSAFNALTADLANGLSTAITKDGQTATTVRIPFAQGINSSLTTDTSSGSTGSIITAGGVGIAKALYVGTNATVVGTLGVTGAATFSTNPVFSSLTASSAVATDASKAFVSVTNTGTGNNVLATSPTLVTPILGTPQSGTLTNCTGLPTTALIGAITEANGGTGTTTGYYGFKNRIINGQMQIAQRATSGTSGNAAPTTAPTYPSLDRFYAYATGATVTVAQVAGTNAIKNNLQVSGAASVTAVGIGQRIEQLNSYDLAGSTATLSVNISNSLLTTVTWTASYATSADTWSAKTQIATGTFTVTSTLTNYNAQITVPSAATTGIEILFTVGAQTSGTWVIGNVQLEKGSTATSFDYRPYMIEEQLCMRYFEKTIDGANGIIYGITSIVGTQRGTYPFKVRKRATPTVANTSISDSVLTVSADWVAIQRSNDNAEMSGGNYSAEL